MDRYQLVLAGYGSTIFFNVKHVQLLLKRRKQKQQGKTYKDIEKILHIRDYDYISKKSKSYNIYACVYQSR